MEIVTRHTGEIVELEVSGRLDAYWANSLSDAIEELVRNGHHHLQLDLAGVTYMSSAGIRVLLKFYKQAQRINGSLLVANPSEAVKGVLELAGLQVLLRAASAAAGVAAPPPARQVERDGVAFEVYEPHPGATLTCAAIGDPLRLAGASFAAAESCAVEYDASAFGLGLGAFGSDFDDCRGRFGEFLAAGGAAAYLPTDASNVADYLVSTGSLLPELQVLYALRCRGSFAQLVRFEHPHGGRAVALSELAESAATFLGADCVGMVMLAESAGLIGAALRRSPALPAGDEDFFAHPGIRERLSYSPERAHARSLVLIVGVVARTPPVALRAFLRPMAGRSSLHAHLHAAAFSYHPLQKGDLELVPLVGNLFETETLQGMLHLIGDDRPIAGSGESELLRGAMWIGPIAEVTSA